ncbi:hypothetical protein [Neptunitalea lumnitzerae]|uniref:Lipoprotein n=1 Tax=Neptunitalea lumnitzerae TaxID=2965509 RepID=A0ABQ5MH53_9FLAO|nr:hypothetical protein [Neptunitalea sp. Y10]GLB48734.1 hypothetical protein Y10_11020 [Neptunitalea sp. Y10]
MKTLIKLTFILILIFSCSNENKTKPKTDLAKKVNYGTIISEYLESRKNEPTLIFNNTYYPNKRFNIRLAENDIKWSEKDNALEIIINGTKVNTSEKVTLNNTWGENVDSVNFANTVRQIKFYESDSLLGFVLTNEPCSGLACSVNYQLIYDLKTKSESYFGRFKTGFELELYDFNHDSRIDFLSKTLYGRKEQMMDTTEFIMYSQTEKGNFQEFRTEEQNRFTFRHIYPAIYPGQNKDTVVDKFEENWIEKINNKVSQQR